MKAFNEKIILRNLAVDPSGGGKNLIAAINAPVTVYETGTTNLASLFDLDENQISNPTSTDIKGNVVFKVNNGVYDIVGGTGENETRWDEVEIIDLNTTGLDKTYATVADMKADTTLRANGSKLINTIDYYSTQRGGGASYLIKTTTQADADGDVYSATTKGNILLDNGDVAVIQVGSTLLSSHLGFLSDNTDEALTFSEVTTLLQNTGKEFRTVAGDNIQIESAFQITGFKFNLVKNSSIKVFGDALGLFENGAIIVNDNGILFGDGDIYSSGLMTGSGNDHIVRQNSGKVEGGLTIYSQLNTGLLHFNGDCSVSVVGGRINAVKSLINSDTETVFNITWFNAGVMYADKSILTPIVFAGDSRAFNVKPSVNITKPITANINGNYSWKNGAWIGEAGFTIDNLTVNGFSGKAGFYEDENGVEQAGQSAGTCIELEACPDAVVNASTNQCKGYNVALVGGSDRAVIYGRHKGSFGDPNVIIGGSNDCIVSATLIDGTFGVSVGEDSSQADGCKVDSSTIVNASFGPFKVSAANNTVITNNTLIGEPTNTSIIGSWTGIGDVFPVVRAISGIDGTRNITLSNNTYIGRFNYEVLDFSASNNKLRVSSVGNSYSCAMLSRENDKTNNVIQTKNGGNGSFTRLSTSTATDGYAGIGEVTMVDGSISSNFLLDAKFSNLTGLQVGGETYEEMVSRWQILIYLKYNQSFNRDGSRILRFTIAETGVSTDSGVELFAVWDAYESTIGRPLIDGEYVPLTFSYFDCIQSGADVSDLQSFRFVADDSSRGYDYVITQPVVIDIGNKPR